MESPEERPGDLAQQKAYEKPTLSIIELVAEEVMGIGCKSEGYPAAGNPTSCMISNCWEAGS